MPHYLLSVHTSATPDEGPPPDGGEMDMAAMMARIDALEDDLVTSGAWVFSGRLTDPDSASVVTSVGGGRIVADGPFAESKEHMAGFYLIEAADGDEALAWAERVTACVGRPIEMRPFVATGRVRDQMPPQDHGTTA